MHYYRSSTKIPKHYEWLTHSVSLGDCLKNRYYCQSQDQRYLPIFCLRERRPRAPDRGWPRPGRSALSHLCPDGAELHTGAGPPLSDTAAGGAELRYPGTCGPEAHHWRRRGRRQRCPHTVQEEHDGYDGEDEPEARHPLGEGRRDERRLTPNATSERSLDAV